MRLLYNVRQHRGIDKGSYAVVYDDGVVLSAGLAQMPHAVVYRFLRRCSRLHDVLQLRDAELVGVGPHHALPSLYAHHAYLVDAVMPLESLEGVDEHGLVVDVDKLFGYVLPHSVAGASGKYDCYVHFSCSFLPCGGLSFVPFPAGTSGSVVCLSAASTFSRSSLYVIFMFAVSPSTTFIGHCGR